MHSRDWLRVFAYITW